MRFRPAGRQLKDEYLEYNIHTQLGTFIMLQLQQLLKLGQIKIVWPRLAMDRLNRHLHTDLQMPAKNTKSKVNWRLIKSNYLLL